MERTQEQPSKTQDLAQKDVKDPKHEGARESRPDRPLAAEGKGEHKDEPAAGDKQVGDDTPDVHAEDGQAMEGEGSEGDGQSKGDDAPSKAI